MENSNNKKRCFICLKEEKLYEKMITIEFEYNKFENSNRIFYFCSINCLKEQIKNLKKRELYLKSNRKFFEEELKSLLYIYNVK